MLKMIAFISIFFPALMFTSAFDALSKRRISRRGFLGLFSMNAFLINGCCLLSEYLLVGRTSIPVYELSTYFLPGDMLRYMGCSIVVGSVLLLVQLMISFSCKVSLESTDSEQSDVEDHDEKETE